MRDRFGIFGAVIRNRKLSLLLVMTLRMSNSRPSSGREREGGVTGVGLDHSWCTACHLALSRAASRHASALAAVDGSLHLTPMGGMRSSTSRRRDRRSPRSCLQVLLAGGSQQGFDHQGASRSICMASASIASHPRTRWPPTVAPVMLALQGLSSHRA